MRRRDFLRAGLVGLAVNVAVPSAGRIARGDEAAAPSVVIEPDKLAESAVEHFMGQGRTCCESILLAGAEALGIESDLVPDIALGLAGGVGLRGETCGALTGAAMVLGIALGPLEVDYAERKKRVLGAVNAFCTEFEKQSGSTQCRMLTGLDLTTPQGKLALKTRVKADRCKELIETVARMLGQALGAAPPARR